MLGDASSTVAANLAACPVEQFRSRMPGIPIDREPRHDDARTIALSRDHLHKEKLVAHTVAPHERSELPPDPRLLCELALA